MNDNLPMKVTRPYSLLEISTLLSCKFIGEENHVISGINEIHMVEIGDIVFVDHPKYYEKALCPITVFAPMITFSPISVLSIRLTPE